MEATDFDLLGISTVATPRPEPPRKAAASPDMDKPRAIAWYRTPINPKVLKSLHARSDLKAWTQTMAHLGLLVFVGGVAIYSNRHWPLGVTIGLVFLYGTFAKFLGNGCHELGHGTVFKGKFLNTLFLRIFSFHWWHNYELFNASHLRHHRYTLHVPEDGEVRLPIKVMVKDFLLRGFFNPWGMYLVIRDTFRTACHDIRGEWPEKLFPKGDPERKKVVNWARVLLIGHGLIVVVSLYFCFWILPLLLTFSPCFGAFLWLLCNNTQHIGLQDDIPDFRLCSRTFKPNPFIRFLFWHMNWHIEHHMYAAVPCYNLKRLHDLIKHDLPPSEPGIFATWKQIMKIQRIQEKDPTYQYCPPLPANSGSCAARE